MAARPFRVVAAALGVVLPIWIWALAGVLFMLRWNAIERPGPPLKELFPYGEMRIGIDPSYPPFAATTGSDLFGLDVDLARALGEHLDIPVRFVPMGFDGLYDSVKADQVDMVISALLIDNTRRGEVFFTQPYFDAGLVLVSNDDLALTTMTDIGGRKLAYEFGSEADAEARRWTRRITPFEKMPYELPQYALDAVRLGLADAALLDAVSARLYLREHSEWRVQMNYVTSAPYVIMIRIDRGATWAAVSRALQALMDDGTLTAILQHWL
jgi:ABC-type amino acid transport substrate-binding protein